MKKIILFAACLSAFSAKAVVMKTCPESIEVKLGGFQNHQVLDDEGYYDNWNGPGIARLQSYLKATPEITVAVDLKYKAGSKCYYEGKNQAGQYAKIKIEGSFKPDAAKAATMVVYATDDLVTYHPLESMQKTGVKLKERMFFSTYYQGEYCSWGDCVPDHIQVGVGSQVSVK